MSDYAHTYIFLYIVITAMCTQLSFLSFLPSFFLSFTSFPYFFFFFFYLPAVASSPFRGTKASFSLSTSCHQRGCYMLLSHRNTKHFRDMINGNSYFAWWILIPQQKSGINHVAEFFSAARWFSIPCPVFYNFHLELNNFAVTLEV